MFYLTMLHCVLLYSSQPSYSFYLLSSSTLYITQYYLTLIYISHYSIFLQSF